MTEHVYYPFIFSDKTTKSNCKAVKTNNCMYNLNDNVIPILQFIRCDEF